MIQDSRLKALDSRSEEDTGFALSYVLCLMSCVLCLFSLLLIGCSKDEGKIRVGVSISGIAHPDSRLIKLAMDDNAGEHGARVLYDQEGLADLLSKGIQVLILSRSVPRELESAITETHHKGIPIVILECPPPQDLHVEACISVNQFEAGKMAADYVVKKLEGSGNVIVLEGPRDDEISRQITLGIYSVLEQNESIRIVADERHPDWDEKLAADNVRFTLRKYANNIQAVLAASSQLAVGAVRAVRERRLADRIVTAGVGADLAACRAIIAGTHDVEIDRNPYGRGLEALNLAIAVARDEDFAYDEEVGQYEPRIKVRFSPLRLITRENVSVMNLAWPELAEKP